MATTKMQPPRDPKSRANLDQIAGLKPGRRGRASLVVGEGHAIALPREILDLLSTVATELREGRSVLVVTGDPTLTPQAAADHLGMSRQFLARLLDRGALPFHRVGSHRRLRLADVRRFAEKRDKERAEALERLRDRVQAEALDA